MDSVFAYNRPAADSEFLSRKKELGHLTSLLKSRKHALIYEPPKTGKRSLVLQAEDNLKKSGEEFDSCRISLLNATDCRTMTEAIRGGVSMTYPGIPVNGIHEPGEILAAAAAEAGRQGRQLFLHIEEGQNILKAEDRERFMSSFWGPVPEGGPVSCIFTGSRINAMKQLADEDGHLRETERVRLSTLEEKAVTDAIIKTFLKVGRVVEPSQAEHIYESLDGHPWYIWHISEICFNLTKGYLSDRMVSEAFHSLLTIHFNRFQDITDSLSGFQISYLKAVYDGAVNRHNMNEIVSAYRLNSPANVHRVREALMKKEVVAFDSDGSPYIIDPLFKMWLKTYYFLS